MYCKKLCCCFMLFFMFIASAQVSKATSGKVSDTIFNRDAIGDLNSSSVRGGAFPGSIQLPGKKTAIGFGGFIKTVSYYDSNKEKKAEVITPGFFDSTDKDGQFGISAKLSRFLFDARASMPEGNLRGYFEVDFTTNSFNIRHAYGSWIRNKSEFLVGQYWSAFMDVNALAYLEGTGEPSISGAIFVRQTQLRYTHKFSDNIKTYLSLEDPSSSDALLPLGFESFTTIPDVIVGISISNKKTGHFQIGGLYRKINIDSLNIYKRNADALSLSFGSHLNIGKKGKMVASGSWGKGIGKYLLGVNGVGGYVNVNKELELLKSYGGFISYQQQLDNKFRFNIAIGTAGFKDLNDSPVQFKNSWYANANLFYQIAPAFVAGIEYIYAESNFKENVNANNNRIQIGIQFF